MRRAIVLRPIVIRGGTLLFAALLLLSGCSAAAPEPLFSHSQLSEAAASTTEPRPESHPAPATSASLADRAPQRPNLFSTDSVKTVGNDIVYTFTAPARWDGGDWLIAGGAAATIGVTMAFDRDIQKIIQRNRNDTTDHIFKAIDGFGAEYSGGVLAAFYLGGEIFNDPNATSVALDGISGTLIASGLIAEPLKYLVGRARPGDTRNAYHFVPFGGNDSFPSGHATQAFVVATVIAEHYDELWVKAASYTLATAVSFGRVSRNLHWASDVAGGAVIGIFVGETVVHLNRNHQLALAPIITPELRGLQLTWSY
jgi:hypothetical protein